MPIGKLMAYQPDGPLGIIGSQGAVVFMENGVTVGRSKVGVLCSSARKLMRVAPSTITSRFPGRGSPHHFLNFSLPSAVASHQSTQSSSPEARWR
jgi:hypothetical protein